MQCSELSAGFTWRFASGLALDAVYGYVFSGRACNTALDLYVYAPGTACGFNPAKLREFHGKNSYPTSVRVRYSFWAEVSE